MNRTFLFKHAMRPADPSDAELLAAMAEKKQWALGVLYDRHAAVLYRITLKILEEPALAQDVLHDTFLAAWNKAAMYDQKLGKVCVWLLVLCRNLAIDRYRAKMNMAVRQVEIENVEEVLPLSEANPENDTLALEQERLLLMALNGLPREQKQVIEMAYFHGMTQQEISEETHTPLGTVKSRTRQAMKKLRISLGAIYRQAPVQAMGTCPAIAA